MDNRKTIFCDIDGCILPYSIHYLDPEVRQQALDGKVRGLPGSVQKINEWYRKGYHIVFTTARDECDRFMTELQLTDVGVRWNQLVMGVGNGQRYLINDSNPEIDGTMAQAIEVTRNIGLKDVIIDD